jgi:glycosyltransferase involved in cell wall biosynthesis
LAANPWTAVALRLLGRRRIAVTGLYAVPGTRSYRVLLRLLRNVPLVTLSRIEAEHWNASGGRAVAVLYGNTYGYPLRQSNEDPGTRIFIGGSSDRDGALITSLEAEVRSTEAAVQLTVVDGGAPGHWSRGATEIRRPGYVSAETFGRLVSESDVVVLPLKDSGRSAGHMVLVGALEAGVPVLATRTQGIGEYIDGQWVRALDPTEPLLPQITAYAAERSGDGERIRHYWRRTFSLPAYVERVCSALDGSSRAPSRSPRRRRRRAVS